MYSFAEAIKFTSFRDLTAFGGLVKVHLQQKLDRLIRLEQPHNVTYQFRFSILVPRIFNLTFNK